MKFKPVSDLPRLVGKETGGYSQEQQIRVLSEV